MPATYEPIGTTTLTGTSATITFSSISSSYTDLRLVFVGTGDANVTLRFNSDTGTNYSVARMAADGSTTERALSSGNTSINTTAAEALPASTPAMITADIFSYAGNKLKPVLITQSQDKNGSGWVSYSVGLWSSTSAITSVTITAIGGVALFNSGTTATLYGIKAA